MKSTIAAILFAAVAATAYGREPGNEISVEISGGLSSISYSSDFGSVKPGAGISAGINYLHRFNKNWGLGTGVNFRLYQSRMEFDKYSDSYFTAIASPAAGTGIDDFRFDYRYSGLKGAALEEKQQAYYLSIPVFAQYEHDCGFYARLGVQVNIPVGGNSKINYETLVTSGYFPYENATYTDIPAHGFSTYLDGEDKETLSYRVNGSLYAEVGWNWDFNDKYILYVGVNGEYGMGKAYKSKTASPQLLYNDGDFGYTPVWGADIADSNGGRKSVTEGKYNNYAVGLVLRYSFGW